ncbi:MAG: YebC/PmpR family DNA-binding transcriptional regulator [Flavobacteriaceae bacterium]|nr:YebC/PmpR family DNA-binding transcriptional regulator [Flavobacteriaceae bacterium]
MGRAFEFRKHRKFKRWGAMSKTFTRLGKDITMTVKEGGDDPKNNSRLRALIQNCKAANMPKENIERAIKKATDKNSENFKELLFEGYGPGGVALLIQTATDNNNRTVGNIRSYFNKVGGNLATSGSVEFLFEHYCLFSIHSSGVELEELELSLIDFGVEEINTEDDSIIIYGPFDQYGRIQEFLENNDYEIISSGFEHVPKNFIEINQTEMDSIQKLLEKLANDEDVQQVFYNMSNNPPIS